MTDLRTVSNDERAVIEQLLLRKPENHQLLVSLPGLHVAEMNDGGMGSLLLVPSGIEAAKRSLGRQIAAAQFTDSDGTPVSICLNIDTAGHLYELDVWKVDFSRLSAWPTPSDLRIQPTEI